MTKNISLHFDNSNFSAQVGDIVYYSHSGVNTGGFNNTDLQNTRKLGPIVEILDRPGRFTVTVQYNDGVVDPPNDGDYISFAKDKRVLMEHLSAQKALDFSLYSLSKAILSIIFRSE